MKMISKKIIFRCLLLLTGIGIITVLLLSITRNQKSNQVNCRVVRVDKGWGYELYYRDKIIIHQEIIPAISGTKPFATRKDAMQTGKLVVQKINKGDIPSITRQELDSLKVNYTGSGYE